MYRTSEGHVVWWHRLDPQDGTRTGVILAHGLIGNAFAFDDLPTGHLLYDPKQIEIAKRVSAEGIPVIATDLAGAAAWGNSSCMDAMDDTVSFFGSSVGARTDRVMLLGVSMGAASVLNWARTNAASVAAIALLLPAVDLQDMIDNNRGGTGGSITTAYGGNPPATSNPIQNTASFSDIPIHIWYSNNDPTCIPSIVTSFASSVGATTTNLGDVGHSATSLTDANLDMETVADWFVQHA